MVDLISIIVPVYNIAEDLPRCLDSILAQNYPSIEIITVDDGSSDHSGTVLDEYAQIHANIRVIHKENGGVTSARLRGVAEASGEWIGFVDGDDEIEPDMYERLLRNAREYDVEISHCGYQMHFPDGRVNYFHNTGVLEKQDRITALRELLSGERVEPGLWNKLFRRSLFEGLSMPLDIKNNEDLLMNYYLFSNAAQTVFDDWCPYHYIVRSTSASRVPLNDHKIYDPIRVRERILQDCPEALRADARKALLRSCVYTYCALHTAGRNCSRERTQVRKIALEYMDCAGALPRSTRLLAEMMARTPRLLGVLYPVYARFLQKKKYE